MSWAPHVNCRRRIFLVPCIADLPAVCVLRRPTALHSQDKTLVHVVDLLLCVWAILECPLTSFSGHSLLYNVLYGSIGPGQTPAVSRLAGFQDILETCPSDLANF